MNAGPYLKRGFTLIELLVVIAIIAILTVVVILTLQPAELLRQARDSNRVSDMDTITHALGIYSEDVGSGMGSSNAVYASIPDSIATSSLGDQCQGLGLPTLPSNYTYHCTNSNYNRNIDGTGWIPVNFKSISSGSPIGNLPMDPTNNSSTRLYYTYATNGTQYEVTAPMESSKYKVGGSNDVITSDGGPLASAYEKGTALGLEPLDYGYSDNSLVGYWPINEGLGSSTYDESGNGNMVTWNGVASGTNGYYSVGHNQPWAGTFNGGTTYLSASSSPSLQLSSNMTLSVWVDIKNASGWNVMISKRDASHFDYQLHLVNGTEYIGIQTGNGSFASATVPPFNTWVMLTATINSGVVTIYLNGAQVATGSLALAAPTAAPLYLGTTYASNGGLVGLMDDARIYNRALSAAEIQSLYIGGK